MKALRRQYALQGVLPVEKCRSSCEDIVETDDIQYIAATRTVGAGKDEMRGVAVALLDIRPTTMAGASEPLSHVAESCNDLELDWAFPDSVTFGDDEKGNAIQLRRRKTRSPGDR